MSWIDELRRLLSRLRAGDLADPGPERVACHEAAERIFEWLDGELEPEMEEAVAEHLEACARCYPRLRFERAFREALARASGGEAPAELEGRIRRSLYAEGFTDS